MKVKILIWAVVCASPVSVARAQFPDQFYTNGKHIDVWKDEGNKKTILWFSRLQGERIAYAQSQVIIYNNDPDWAYYVNLGTKKFVGKYSFERDKYQWLPPEKQKTDLADIEAEDFERLDRMPTVKMLGPGNDSMDRLREPPPTAMHPRLDKSEWDSAYINNFKQKVKARLKLDGAEGSYSFTNGKQTFTGNLVNVRYQKKNGQFEITGLWKRNLLSGYFRFRVSPENLNLFEGEWGQQNDVIEGVWTGSRVRADRTEPLSNRP